jgi:ABC-type branched-subunit amino acid transport system ATPase component/ABC-type branched-subunit amino acid transport system permease subunit
LQAWMVGCTLAAASGVLILPFVGLSAIGLTFLVLQAFGAAAIGAFRSLPLTYVGALGLGIVAAVSQKYVVNISWLSGLPDSLPFIILFITLLVLPRSKLVRPSTLEDRQPLLQQLPGRAQIGGGILVTAVLVCVPFIVGTKLSYYTVGLTSVIMLLALGLLVRSSGQVSMCHTVFAAIGAVAFCQFAGGTLHIPWLISVFLGAIIVVPIGALLAIPAIRLSGLFLALATLGFGVLVENLFYPATYLFTPAQGGRSAPRPDFASGDRAYYYTVLLFALGTALVIVTLHKVRFGRVLRSLADSPLVTATMGVGVNTTRLLVFCVSVFFAALSGELYASAVHFAVPSDSHFVAFSSLSLLAILVIAPFGEPWYALIGGVAAIVPGYLSGANVANWLNVLFGVSALFVAVQGGPARMPARLRALLVRGVRSTAPAQRTGPEVETLPSRPLEPSRQNGGLEVIGLTIRFGGVLAVDDLSISAPYGTVTGLIGPNGAGKTSTFDACSGLNRRVGGQIRLHGVDVTQIGPAGRARLGLGRSFQQVALCDRLSVEENVGLGREGRFAGANPVTQMVARRGESDSVRAATAEALQLCGIEGLAKQQVAYLPTGQRRLVELARCIAGGFDMVLLDEPSAGLNGRETDRLGQVIRDLVERRRCGILLVEHDMALVMSISDYVYVLDYGRLLFEGEPSSVRAAPDVQAAYLGM